MTFSRSLAVVVLLLIACGACDSAPTDPRITPAVGPPTRISVGACDYVGLSATCPAEARWGEMYSTTREVTQAATWTSSNPAVLRVAAPGVLMAETPGEAQATVSYGGTSTSETFRIFANEPPWRVCKSSGCEYHIDVRDAHGGRVGSVLVEIIAGHMQGRSAVSTDFGSAIFVGDIVHGPITVRATKPGYLDWIGSGIIGGKAPNGPPGGAEFGPVVMVPAP
jgi:hypothetical protein